MKNYIDPIFLFVKNKLFSEKTKLIYDRLLAGHEEDFPTPLEIAAGFPNPCGYSTGMEDSILSGSTMLDSCLLRFEKEGDPNAAAFAKELIDGMLRCTAAAKSEGFLPRSVSPADGVSHYPDSSRDQYTLFAFAMHRYLRSELCSKEERQALADTLTAIARRAEKNMTESSCDMLTDDNRPTLVTLLWGERLGNHEVLRLPMLYLAAFEASGDRHWLKKYRELRGEAFSRCLPMGEYWALYTLQQMQASILLCYEADPDYEWQQKYLALMHTVANYAESLADSVRKKIDSYDDYNLPLPPFRELPIESQERFLKLGYPDALYPVLPDGERYFALQDGAMIAITAGLVPGRNVSEKTKELLQYGFSRINLAKHQRNLPLYYLCGFYRTLP